MADVRRGVAIHATLVAVSIALWPFAVQALWLTPRPGWPPVAWVTAAVIAAIGLPFAILSATSPLLQVWLARASSEPLHVHRLYAASNVASVLGLGAYVALLEPFVGVRRQSVVLWLGYAGAMIVALIVARRSARPRPAADPAELADSGAELAAPSSQPDAPSSELRASSFQRGMDRDLLRRVAVPLRGQHLHRHRRRVLSVAVVPAARRLPDRLRRRLLGSGRALARLAGAHRPAGGAGGAGAGGVGRRLADGVGRPAGAAARPRVPDHGAGRRARAPAAAGRSSRRLLRVDRAGRCARRRRQRHRAAVGLVVILARRPAGRLESDAGTSLVVIRASHPSGPGVRRRAPAVALAAVQSERRRTAPGNWR